MIEEMTHRKVDPDWVAEQGGPETLFIPAATMVCYLAPAK